MFSALGIYSNGKRCHKTKMHRPSGANQALSTDAEHDSLRLAGWEQQGGYSPFVPLPGMVAHGQFSPTNDPNPVYNFGQFNTPCQRATCTVMG